MQVQLAGVSTEPVHYAPRASSAGAPGPHQIALVDQQLPWDPRDEKFTFMKLIEFFLPASQHVLAQNKL